MSEEVQRVDEDVDQHEGECVCCARGQTLSELIDEGIKSFGYAIMQIMDQPFAFCYTIGLTETYDHPEFIMRGDFSVRQMADLIGVAVDALGENPNLFQDEEVYGIIKVNVHGTIEDRVLGCRAVNNVSKQYLAKAADRYGGFENFQAKQLVLPDTHGMLPWQIDFDDTWGDYQDVLYGVDENER